MIADQGHDHADRRLCADRRLQDGGFGRPRRLDRLVVLAAVRFGCMLCRSAGDGRERPLAACSEVNRFSRSVGTTAPARSSSKPSSKPRPAVRRLSISCLRRDGAHLVRIVAGPVRARGFSQRVRGRASTTGRPSHGSTGSRMARSTRLPARSAWSCARPAALHGEDLETVGEFTVEAGQSVPFVLSYGSSFKAPPPAIDPFNALERTEAFWQQWSDRCPEVGPWTRSGQTLAHHIEGFDLRADRRNRRRRHDVASRALGRRAELGLPLLLAAGRHLHAVGVHAARLLRRSTGVARLAHSRGRRQPEPGPDHVRSGRGTVVAGIDRPLAARV